jgi:hypothetical protein
MLVHLPWGHILTNPSKLKILEVERTGGVVHTCDPSYSGGGDQEDHSSRPVQAKS